MYGRNFDGKELSFEPSGALEKASLVMRDRETDSWWSLMSHEGIGGEHSGDALQEMPGSEKVQWSEWVKRHPDTLVLSVGGVEYEENNPYDNYLTGEDTFRGVEVEDDRLDPKQPIYSFWWDEKPLAVSHVNVAGGSILPLPGGDRVIALWRDPQADIMASSRALIFRADVAAGFDSAQALFAAVDSGEIKGAQSPGGFDTYWYTWILVNPGSGLLAP